MLLQLRDYLKREKTASNQQMARVFQIDLSALEPMLAILSRREMIEYLDAPSTCKQACVKCPPQSIVYYRFRSV